jgi:hypothetical protein
LNGVPSITIAHSFSSPRGQFHQRLEFLPAGLDESFTDDGLLDAVSFRKAARHQRVVPRGQTAQHLPPDLVVQMARLLE